MRARFRRLAAIGMSLALLAGCSSLPDSGPVEAQVLDAARRPQTNPLGFRIVPVTPDVLGAMAADDEPGLASLDNAGTDASRNERIGAGDVLQISILELGSGLFSGTGSPLGATQAGSSNPSASVTTEALPPIQVGSQGDLEVPYAGRLRAAGRTTTQFGDTIQAALRGKSQNPQVLVRIVSDVANSVIVAGDIHKPGREPLTLAHERLLDMVAIAGGPTFPSEDIVVRLVRAGKTRRIALKTLEDRPDQNIPLLPGDRIQVVDLPRSFTVFGAAPKVSMLPFNAASLSLAEALARIGGPLDERADPNAVFLFRFESAATAGRLRLPVRPGVKLAPVVYQLDMMNPTSYFLAQRFAMKDKDLLYIANAKTNRLYKFMSLVSLITGPAITAAFVSQGN